MVMNKALMWPEAMKTVRQAHQGEDGRGWVLCYGKLLAQEEQGRTLLLTTVQVTYM